MSASNTDSSYGWVAISLHWLVAVSVVTLFALGLWMEDLDYTHPWYQIAPHLHKSIGVLVVVAMILRLLWKLNQREPSPFAHYKQWEITLARYVHYSFYLLILLMFPTGYFITTAKGNSLEVFNWFSIPAVIDNANNLADTAGEVHEWIAFTIIGLVGLHAAGALKHHFIDRDGTFLRIIGRSKSN